LPCPPEFLLPVTPRKTLPLKGWPEEHARALEITGGTDPILPTPFRIGETSTARTRPGAGGRPQGRATGIHSRRARALVDDQRHAGRSTAPSRAGGAPLRDTTSLGPARGATGLPRAGMAGADHVAVPRTVFALSPQGETTITTHRIRLGVIGTNPYVGSCPRRLRRDGSDLSGVEKAESVALLVINVVLSYIFHSMV
jgi:hypothetical protein